jgi:hypothetical protein
VQAPAIAGGLLVLGGVFLVQSDANRMKAADART